MKKKYSENKIKGKIILPKKNIEEVIEMLKQHHYTQTEMDECDWNANNMESLDAQAFDNSIMINLLGGKLDD